MHEDLRLLKELQDIDYWIGELERSKEFLPGMMRDLENEVERLAADFKQKKERLTQAQVELKELELRVTENKDHIKKFQDQMLTIKTNKEYDALVAQIESSKVQVGADEELSLELMNEIEELKQEVADLEGRQDEITKNHKERLEALQTQLDSVQGKVDQKEVHRDHLKAKVPKQAMSIYERVRRGKGADVVVKLKRGACGGCYKSQPPQKIQMIKKGETIQTCASCGRILIWEGDD